MDAMCEVEPTEENYELLTRAIEYRTLIEWLYFTLSII
jgi:hypothetical protein